MIAATSVADQREAAPDGTWQRALADAVTDPAELLDLLDLKESPHAAGLAAAFAAARDFPLRVPRGFVARMRRGEPDDPLLRQVLPDAAEFVAAPGFLRDPVGDLASRTADGVLQKYSGRALLIATGACAIHCRYCFRRHFPYAEELASAGGWRDALRQLAAAPQVTEVILSGGDPLSLGNRRLRELTDGLARLPHVRRLRLHTRTAVVLPERIDTGLLAWWRSIPLQKVIVVHVNHAHEIDTEVRRALAVLKDSGTVLLNQSVLLAGVNDSVPVLCELSETLFDAGVQPYYLHLLDRVCGASHFEVAASRASVLVAGMAARLPGYLVPKLVREVEGAPAKTPVPAGLADEETIVG